jgi:5'-nucleotidase
MTHLNWVRGVPIVQSGTEGNAFGRIDFRLDATTHRLVPQGIRAVAGIPITIQECAPQTDGWCEKDSNGTVRWSGVAVHPQPELQKTLDESREALRPLAERVLGEVLSAPLTRSRISASPLTNLLTDLLKKVSGAEIALLNTGGIRADLPAGRLTYEHLFRTLPFNNHAVVAGPLQWSTLKALLQKSIETCGQYGALLPAGLRVEFRRECGAVKGSPTRPIDPGARLERVQLSTGEILLDRESGTEISADRGFIVATLDFLLSGGSNYREFTGTPLVVDLGIFRERLAETLARTPLVVHPDDLRDSRWVELPTEN